MNRNREWRKLLGGRIESWRARKYDSLRNMEDLRRRFNIGLISILEWKNRMRWRVNIKRNNGWGFYRIKIKEIVRIKNNYEVWVG